MLREPGVKEGLRAGGAGPEGINAEGEGRGGARMEEVEWSPGERGGAQVGRRWGGCCQQQLMSSLGVSSLLPGTRKERGSPGPLGVYNLVGETKHTH